VTGYYLEAGYQSGASREEAWEALKRITLEICETPTVIAEEALAYGCPVEAEGTHINKFAESYRARTDLTIRIKEKGDIGVDEDAETGKVVQYASGGGQSRIMKEHFRRAFCRLAIRRMHAEGYEVNMTVA